MHPPPRPSPSGISWLAYRLIRPVARPIAWRLRSFFAGPLHDELTGLRAELRALHDEIGRRDVQDAAAIDRRIVDVIERALLTLALDREASATPPPPPRNPPSPAG